MLVLFTILLGIALLFAALGCLVSWIFVLYLRTGIVRNSRYDGFTFGPTSLRYRRFKSRWREKGWPTDWPPKK